MQTNKSSNTNRHKILKTNIEYLTQKRVSDLSTDYLHSSNFSTKLTNTNVNHKKPKNSRLNTLFLNNRNENYNTINEHLEDELYLSKRNLEYDLHITNLKKQLEKLKNDRKKAEINVIHLKKKILELQNKEIASSRQLEYTKKYIKKIMKNSKNKINKNYGIIITKINNIYQNNKNLGNFKLNIKNSSNYKTWVQSKRSAASMVNPDLKNLSCYTAIKSNYINNIPNKKVKTKRNLIKSQINEKTEFIETVKDCSSPITNKIYIKKTITSNRKTKNYQNIKDNIIKKIKRDIDEKLRIEREIERINKEQNKLYNNFYENFVILRSAKTLDVND